MLGLLTYLRQAARSLRQTPVTTGASILCLALGLGATTAIFSAVSRALLQPLPFRDPAGLVTVYRTTPQFDRGPFAPANFLDLRAETRTLQRLVAVFPSVGLMEAGSASSRVSAYRASPDLFSLLGVTALRGRLLEADDERPDRPPVVVVSEDVWRSQFGADPALVGSAVRLNGQPRIVVGIVERRFRVPIGSQWLDSDLWVPLQFAPAEAGARRNNSMWLVGRLKPGQSVASASAELTSLMRGLTETHPELKGEDIQVVSLPKDAVKAVRGPLLLLFGAVGFVLLIAAANVVSLLLARGADRRREISIRTALGADRASIMRAVVVESVLLATVGLTLGLLLAWAGVRGIGALAAARLPQLAGLSLDLRVLSFALISAAIVALAAGIVPAWRVSESDPQEALRQGGSRIGQGRGHQRLLRGLIMIEAGLSLVLLLGAGLVLRGFITLVGNDPGFDPKPLLTMVVSLSPDRYGEQRTVERFLHPALEAVRAVPGVVSASAISLIPYDNWGNNFNVWYEGSTDQDETRRPLVENRAVTPEFFPTVGMTLLQGRLLQRGDDESDKAPPVVVVNRALVKRDFPNVDPIGKRFHTSDTSFATIVGVVADIRNFGPASPPQPEMYWSYTQYGTGIGSFPFIMRVSGSPTSVTKVVTAALRTVDPTAAVSLVRPMEDVINESVGRPKFYLLLLGVFAGVALLLSTAGLYGITSYAVARRTREIGIRTALGSSAGTTVGLILREGMGLVAGGLVVGGVAAFGLTRLLTGLLYGTSPVDPIAWAGVALTLVLVSAAALIVPARRAARVDPMVAIREE